MNRQTGCGQRVGRVEPGADPARHLCLTQSRTHAVRDAGRARGFLRGREAAGLGEDACVLAEGPWRNRRGERMYREWEEAVSWLGPCGEWRLSREATLNRVDSGALVIDSWPSGRRDTKNEEKAKKAGVSLGLAVFFESETRRVRLLRPRPRLVADDFRFPSASFRATGYR
jgi:hypothetical protein